MLAKVAVGRKQNERLGQRYPKQANTAPNLVVGGNECEGWRTVGPREQTGRDPGAARILYTAGIATTHLPPPSYGRHTAKPHLRRQQGCWPEPSRLALTGVWTEAPDRTQPGGGFQHAGLGLELAPTAARGLTRTGRDYRGADARVSLVNEFVMEIAGVRDRRLGLPGRTKQSLASSEADEENTVKKKGGVRRACEWSAAKGRGHQST